MQTTKEVKINSQKKYLQTAKGRKALRKAHSRRYLKVRIDTLRGKGLSEKDVKIKVFRYLKRKDIDNYTDILENKGLSDLITLHHAREEMDRLSRGILTDDPISSITRKDTEAKTVDDVAEVAEVAEVAVEAENKSD